VVAVAALGSGASAGVRPGTDPPGGARAYYSFDHVSGTTVYNDAPGISIHNGTLEDATITTGGGGIIGEGMAVADVTPQRMTIDLYSGGAVDLPDTASGGGWTISAWIYNLYPSDSLRILTAASIVDYQFIIMHGSNDLQSLVLGGLYDSKHDLLPGDGWHHIAAVASGGETKFYVDGVGTEDNVIPAASSTDIKYIGGRAGMAFAEVIDEFYIYDRALNETEIGRFVVQVTTGITAPVEDLQDGPPLETAVVAPHGDDEVGGLYGIWLSGDCVGGDPDYRWSISGGPEALSDTLLAEVPDTDLDGSIDDYFLTFAQLAEAGAMDRAATAPYTLRLEALDSGGLPIPGSESEILLLVPEPATLSLLALGGLTILRRRRKLETATCRGAG